MVGSMLGLAVPWPGLGPVITRRLHDTGELTTAPDDWAVFGQIQAIWVRLGDFISQDVLSFGPF